MAFPIEDKLVIAVASSALFRLDVADEIYRSKGLSAYRKYQREHEDTILEPGIAFPFIRRFLKFNELFPDTQPVEVVLLSHNDPDTGNRVLRCIDHYGLGITRSAFLTDGRPVDYIDAYNVSLFLSGNESDVRDAISSGFAAGYVLDSKLNDDGNDDELRVAFDFDGVLADDSAEQVFQHDGIDGFWKSESSQAGVPLGPGPLADLFTKLSRLHTMEEERKSVAPDYHRFLRTAIVTARSGPAQWRLATTLRNWNITVDQTFTLGGMNKSRILKRLRPHIYFDDQWSPHLEAAKEYTPSVHIPFGCVGDCMEKRSSVSDEQGKES